MNTVFVIIQYIGIVLLLIEIVCILCQPASFAQSMMLIFTATAFINTIGYLMELTATNQELALYAVKFTYIGKPYIILSMFLFMLNYCRVSFPKSLGIVLFGIHSFIVFSVMTCEKQTWFYKSISFTNDGPFPHLVLEHGVVYYLYMILIVVYSVISFVLCARCHRQTKDHSEKVQTVYLIEVILIPLISFLIYLSDITKGYDLTAPSYIVCATMLLICSVKYNFLGVLRRAKDDVLDNMRDGVVFLNKRSELLYTNSTAAKLFPGLSTLMHPYTILEIQEMLKHNENLYVNDKIFALIEQPVYDQKKIVGTLIKIEDVTESHRYTERLKHDVKEKTKEINQMQTAFITSFTDLVEARDGFTGTHIKNTSNYVAKMCEALQDMEEYQNVMTNEYMETIIEAAPMHDIGKIAIPDAILQKPGKLSSDEFEIIKTHAEKGEAIIQDIMKETGENEKLITACKMAKFHHERWDGKGYPTGISGRDIPLCARIMALADVYDALCSKRSYKDEMPKEKALQIIEEGSGTQFDPDLTNVFLKCFR